MEINQIVTKVEQYIHGAAREQIISQLEQNPTAKAVAAITYKIVIGADEQATQKGVSLELDILMAVATEAIDMLIEIMEAMGAKFNADEMREESLLQLVILHMEQVGDDPEEKAAAEEMLAVLTEDGTMQKSMEHIDSKADASSEQMLAAGQQMVAPQKKPVAAGVQRGLMEG